MFVETSITAIMTSAATAIARRDRPPPVPSFVGRGGLGWRLGAGGGGDAPKCVERPISLGLFEVDHDRIGSEKCDHDRQKIEYVAQVDDATRDRAEMTEEA